MLVFKLVIIGLLLVIVFSLGSALFAMIKGNSNNSMTRYLGRRVAFSALVILLLLVAMALGLVQPNPRPY
ncbi:DUF2909 domain-containing protein [Paraferrimonas haliotis]|uniref:DUF2909 domain-containing protein n=1 Tax=Paraferrimonas haliotis TaxID=2013866 RepID=A0AA37TVK4_9GAMM|nr:DUF2909 domain-containing protein [Paraferrimonas haliotis]GLS83500.1 hypothetical protein GCM10007894_14770 [Paraferrimonas haliotis]